MNDPLAAGAAKTPKKHLPIWVFILAGVILLGFLVLLATGLLLNRQQALTLGSRVEPFSVTSFDGTVISTADLHGKTVLLNFWASWCTTCVDEAAILEQAWRKVSPDQKIVFIGVDYADTEPAARAFLQKYGIDYTNAPDLRSALSQQFRITGVPETYLIGGDGTLSGIKIGPFTSLDELMTFLGQK
jgi:cytochrome c biogenesis protein CcmG/thiol:disulfide interchange protein DsbE